MAVRPLRRPETKTKSTQGKGPRGGSVATKSASKSGSKRVTKRASKRVTKPVVEEPAARKQTPCLDCGLCCTYLAFEINGPTTVKHASEILWQLYHERVSVYRDTDDEWFVQVETRCQHLQPDNKCGIYATRPHVCRDYSEETCEINADDVGMTFFNAAEFLEFLSQRRKKVYAKLIDGYAPSEPEALAKLRARRDGGFRKRLTVLRG